MRPGELSIKLLLVTLAMASTTAILLGQTSPADLVRETVENEIKSTDGGAYFMFRDYKQTGRGSQTKLVVETREAMAGMVVAINGKPLTTDQRRAELARLDSLANNPDELKKKQRAEKADAQRTMRIVSALPEAFLYERDGSETGRQGVGRPGDELVRLKFWPNPKYSPPSRVEEVLTGMQGYMLIDENQHRLAQIDGTLFKQVSFGWGILGHLDKGGHFLVEQASMGEGAWEVTRMDLAFTGRILLFKGINFKSNEVFTDFRPAPPNLTFAGAVELLKKQAPAPVETYLENGGDPPR